MKLKSMVLLLCLLISLVASCGNDSSPPNDYTAFSNPELVTINGYSGDAMEPFISRDGSYLFFNNNAGVPTEKDMFYATRINDTTYQFRGDIAVINSATVDGVPTMDVANKFYYVSLANYDGTSNFVTLYSGTWTGSTVTGITPLSSLAIAIPVIIYFDIEVSLDGSTLYLSVGDFSGGRTVPSDADILIAVDSGSGFTPDLNSTAIMANVNTNKLEYAPAISANGLELFFTRFDQSTDDARIYRTVRPNISSAFGSPQLVSNITGFVEGPAFSPDEKALYYHRHDPVSGKFEIYRVTRP